MGLIRSDDKHQLTPPPTFIHPSTLVYSRGHTHEGTETRRLGGRVRGRGEKKAAKEILRAMTSERIAWESEPITGQTGQGMGRHREGCGEVLACI